MAVLLVSVFQPLVDRAMARTLRERGRQQHRRSWVQTGKERSGAGNAFQRPWQARTVGTQPSSLRQLAPNGLCCRSEGRSAMEGATNNLTHSKGALKHATACVPQLWRQLRKSCASERSDSLSDEYIGEMWLRTGICTLFCSWSMR